jgi:hypothetical protein
MSMRIESGIGNQEGKKKKKKKEKKYKIPL